MRRAGLRLAMLCLATTVGVACAGPVSSHGDGFRHRRHDWRIGAPDGPGPAWERFDLEGAALAFRRSGRSSLSLQSTCGRPVATPALMARHLVIGLPERQLLTAGPIDVAGRGGWSQTFASTRNGVALRIKTVTVVAGDCTFDWTLVATPPYEADETAFDAWWSSFELGVRHDTETPG
jgi:hypothetical protein